MLPETPEELNQEFQHAGFPPLPRTEATYLEDEYNFKKAIMNPKEPMVNGEPNYTSTMALGNLTTDEVSAMRDDFRIARILERYNYPTLVESQYYHITDRVLSTQNHQATLLAALTVQQYGMRRVESSSREEQAAAEEAANPVAKLITAIRGAPASANGMAQKRDDTMARYRT